MHKRRIKLQTKSIFQLRKIFRRARRAHIEASARLSWAKTPLKARQYEILILTSDLLMGEIRVELARRKIPADKLPSFPMLEEMQAEAMGKIVFTWKPVRIWEREEGNFYSTSRWAWCRKVRRFDVDGVIYHTEV